MKKRYKKIVKSAIMLIGVLSYPTIDQVYTNTLGSKIIETLPDFDFSLCELLIFMLLQVPSVIFFFILNGLTTEYSWKFQVPNNECRLQCMGRTRTYYFLPSISLRELLLHVPSTQCESLYCFFLQRQKLPNFLLTSDVI